MKKVGILGGAFNPPHIGHLLIAEHVREHLLLDEIWFVPTFISPHKESVHIPVKHRLAMLDRAIEDNEHFLIHKIEIERKGISYTIDTIKAFKEKYPKVNFYFIIGADMVEYLPKWKQIDQLIELVTFVGVRRLDYQLQTPYPIKIVDIPLINLSSSYIRQRIKKNQSIKYLVTKSVEKYIKEHNLYGYSTSKGNYS